MSKAGNRKGEAALAAYIQRFKPAAMDYRSSSQPSTPAISMLYATPG